MGEEIKSRYATKKKGKTEVYPFWELKDFKSMMDYFLEHEQWEYHFIFMLGLLLGRRIGDTIALRWSDLYFENGKIKDEINTIREQKTGKIVELDVSPYAKECIRFYIEKTGLNPMQNLNEFVFPSKLKTQWLKHADAKIYQGKTQCGEGDQEKFFALLDKWLDFIGRDLSTKYMNGMWNEWKNKHDKRNYHCVEEYLYEEELAIIVKGQISMYQSEFKKAAEASGILYNVNTHSTRKNFGYWTVQIHPHDVNILEELRDFFGHKDVATTSHYIGLTREDRKRIIYDMSDLIQDVAEGKEYVIKNQPVITLKTSDLREVLTFALTMEKSEDNLLDCMNQVMEMVESRRVV
jgi:integrase